MHLLGIMSHIQNGTEMESIDDPIYHTDSCFSTPCVRNFTIGEPFSDEIWDETGNKWAVFGNVEGGNCWEHYLRHHREGWIMNFGGEYPTWSEEGHTWQEYRPSIFSQLGCMNPSQQYSTGGTWREV